MLSRALIICLISMLPVFAGQVISYTATSKVSQEEANNTAIAGVAKQISSRVQVKQTLTKEETLSKNQDSLSESYRSQSDVQSDIFIKGVSVTPVKTDKGFKATATLDLDKYTADLQYQIKSAQKKVQELETIIENSLQGKQYSIVAKSISEERDIIRKHASYISKLAQIYPINDSHRLQENISTLETKLIQLLNQIKIDGPHEQITVNSSEMQPWEVTVSDNQGPVNNFPIVVKQGFRTLLERRTQADGKAVINLRNINIEKGPYVITVEPNFPESLVEAAGLKQKFELTYKVSSNKCEIRLQCNELANTCRAVEASLAKKSIFVTEETSAPLLDLHISVGEAKPLQINANTLRYSYPIEYTLKGKSIAFSSSISINGKNATDATIKGTGKINFSDLQKQLAPYCR